MATTMWLSKRGREEEEEEGKQEEEDEEPFSDEANGGEEDDHAPILPFSRRELDKLHRFPLISRRVTQQTGKGKIHRRGVLVVVGNGNGLVGYGEAKHDDGTRATNRAFVMAVRNMDYVDRFEGRTIWTEMSSKLGATRIILRPRPVGFGLHCNPNIHQVLKAAGIKDISAKVWGSRNPLNVIKLLFRMLHAGNAPLAMGNGIGGPGRKLDKGSGVRGKHEIELERGRKLLNLRTR
jgi:small subunit ribosomal protein S5